MNPRLQVMLDSRQIEEAPSADAELIGMWDKALRTFRSSRLDGLDPESGFTLAYQAALQAATTVVRAAGFRVRGEGHHHHTFAAAAAVGDREVADAARELNVIRQQRHGAVYDWEARVGERELAHLDGAAAGLFHAAHPWLAAVRPGIAGRITAFE